MTPDHIYPSQGSPQTPKGWKHSTQKTDGGNSPPPPSLLLPLSSPLSLDLFLLFFLLFFLCFLRPPSLPAADSVDPSPADIFRRADLKSSISRQTSSSHAWCRRVRWREEKQPINVLWHLGAQKCWFTKQNTLDA